tara:strand:+ start:103 stop:1044 length:942 start_codon:yes stop_codon:yes gene_type:complete
VDVDVKRDVVQRHLDVENSDAGREESDTLGGGGKEDRRGHQECTHTETPRKTDSPSTTDQRCDQNRQTPRSETDRWCPKTSRSSATALRQATAERRMSVDPGGAHASDTLTPRSVHTVKYEPFCDTMYARGSVSAVYSSTGAAKGMSKVEAENGQRTIRKRTVSLEEAVGKRRERSEHDIEQGDQPSVVDGLAGESVEDRVPAKGVQRRVTAREAGESHERKKERKRKERKKERKKNSPCQHKCECDILVERKLWKRARTIGKQPQHQKPEERNNDNLDDAGLTKMGVAAVDHKQSFQMAELADSVVGCTGRL